MEELNVGLPKPIVVYYTTKNPTQNIWDHQKDNLQQKKTIDLSWIRSKIIKQGNKKTTWKVRENAKHEGKALLTSRNIFK